MESKKIFSVKPNSPAHLNGIKSGDILMAVNGEEFTDIIDLSFLFADECIELDIQSEDGSRRSVQIGKSIDEDLGLEFSTAVFDHIKTCHNNCIFCFVDQMHPGMRDSLYVKDDDYRLSFLFGNFITLTNLSDADKKRIKTLNLSPLYVSVHATDGETRKNLIRNKHAGDVLLIMKDLAQSGIEFHTQVVLCPGINDSSILEKTFQDLWDMRGSVLSMAVVPVGLTKFAPNKEGRLRSFTENEAVDVIDKINLWQKECRRTLGKSFVYAADEFYVKAKREFPAAEYYDGFCQYENGIGICRKFIDEWQSEKADIGSSKRRYSIVCGVSAEKILQELVLDKHDIITVENDFFGPMVTVTGLITAGDIISKIKSLAKPPATVVIPAISLKNDDEQVFLDDITLKELEDHLQCEVVVAKNASALKKIVTR